MGEAEIIDYTYPLKGCGAWRGYGWQLRNNIVDILRKLLKECDHEETYFPFLIPKPIFMKEAEFIKGFENEVYWVTQGGQKTLDVELAIRPTSETPIYFMFAKWIKTHADLPIKVWQIVSVFRYETKSTKPLLRVREITTFKEAHTAHSTSEEAESQAYEGIEIYKTFFDELCIPYVISKRPDYDKFPGSEYTMSFETIFPGGRTLQIGTVHNLGQRFAKAFDIRFTDKQGTQKYVHQTCYGVSERVIAAVIAIHGDDFGLVLPPKIAPFQAVIVPIPSKEINVIDYAQSVMKKAKKFFRIHIDLRDKRPAEKFYDWEIKGVPLRLEVGPRETRQKIVTLVRRDNFDRKKVSIESLCSEISEVLTNITLNLKEKSWNNFEQSISSVEKFISLKEPDAISALMTEDGQFAGGIVKLPLCSSQTCEFKITEFLNILGSPSKKKAIVGQCSVCELPANRVILASKQY